MPIVPSRVQDLLDFAQLHAPVFSGAFAQIGISQAQATKFSQATTKAIEKYTEALAADSVKKAATSASQDAVRELRKSAAETLAFIKAFAENQPNPTVVYDTAQVPAPQPPQPIGPPGTPDRFTIGLAAGGAVIIGWRCANPPGSQGTQYEVRRRTTASPNFALLGIVGQKRFVDDALSAGSSGVVYEITATRSTIRGMSAQFNVNFGVGAGGQMTVSISPVEVDDGSMTGVRMAA